MTFIWTSGAPHYREGDPARCRASVHHGDSRMVIFAQCSRKPVVFRDIDHPKGRFGFCRQHDPVTVELRERARQKRWGEQCRQQQESWQKVHDIEDAKDSCVEALRQIEAGHNDPRALARETLAQLDALGDEKDVT